MVHRLEKLVPEAWVRAGRTLVQNVLSVAAVAVGPALVTASAGGGPVDYAALGIAGGQAALAAALAYVHNVVRPANGGKLGETTWRAGRTFLQNIVAAAVVPGAAAIASTGGDDWKMLGMAGVQAAVAGLIALAHNRVAPRATEPAGEAGGPEGAPVDGGEAQGSRLYEGPSGGRYGTDSDGGGYGRG